MHHYAQIDGGRVAVGLLQTSKQIDAPHMIELVAFDQGVLGKRHDEETNTWGEVPGEASSHRRMSGLAFRRRFTKAERAAIEWAAVDRAEATIAQRMQAAALRADLKDQDSAQYIDLDDGDTVAGVQALEAGGLIAAGRAAEILGAPIEPGELP